MYVVAPMSSAPPCRRLRAQGLVLLASGVIAVAGLGCGRISYDDVHLAIDAPADPPADARDGDGRRDDARPAVDEAPPPDAATPEVAVMDGQVTDLLDGRDGADAGPADTAGPRLDVGPLSDSGDPLDASGPETPPAEVCRNPTFTTGSLLADFEAGTATTVVFGDRGGTPFTPANASVTAESVLVAPQCANRRAMLYRGPAVASGTSRVLQTRFKLTTSSPERFLDARRWRGIRFAARTGGAWSTLRIKVPDRNTSYSGGTCTACEDHFQIAVTISAAWQVVDIPFASLAQTGAGDRFPALETSALFALEFTASTSQAFEFWIDDLAFLE
jgi:hypothetical protein